MDIKSWSTTRKIISLIIVLLVVAAAVALAFAAMRPAEPQQPTVPPDDQQQTASPEETVRLSGVLVCLPHKNSGDHQTTECLTGLRSDDGKYYGLKDPSRSQLRGAPFNKPVEVQGTLQKEQDDIYQMEGTITLGTLQVK